MAESFKTLWSEVASIAARSEGMYNATKHAIAAIGGGWRFQGCPDGMLWSAIHRVHGTLTRRSGPELVEAVRQADAEAKEKAAALQQKATAR